LFCKKLRIMKKTHQQQLINAIVWVGTAIAISIDPENWILPMIVGYFATASTVRFLTDK
jgi:hypothetical protein